MPRPAARRAQKIDDALVKQRTGWRRARPGACCS